MSTDDKEHASPIAEEVFGGEAHFDLTSPPSRQAAGIPDGRSEITYQRQEPFFVRVSLPDGHELALDARLVGFDSLSAPDPATAPPTTLDIHYYPASLAEGRDHLLAVADQFGLEQRAFTDWYQRATNPGAAPGPPTLRSRWVTTTVGYLYLQVRATYRPPADAAGAEQTIVHYSLTWGEDATRAEEPAASPS